MKLQKLGVFFCFMGCIEQKQEMAYVKIESINVNQERDSGRVISAHVVIIFKGLSYEDIKNFVSNRVARAIFGYDKKTRTSNCMIFTEFVHIDRVSFFIQLNEFNVSS